MSSEREERGPRASNAPRMARLPTKTLPAFTPGTWIADPFFRGHELALTALADLPHWPTAEELDARLGPIVARALGAPLCFRAQMKSEPMRYEATIVVRREVPTRDGSPHDLLNALVWATFPRSKFALHERFHEAEAARAVPGRTRFQDRLTLLDEGAALRGDEGGPAWLFGHAILEHRIAHHAGARAELFVLPSTELTHDTASVDRAFAAALRGFPDPAPPRPAGVSLLELFPEASP
jgi:hypothetical protein